MTDRVLDLLSARMGHFLFESGHHGDRWLDLESLCLHPRHVKEAAAVISEYLSHVDVEFVCGPLVESAFVGLMVAMQLDCRFIYSERHTRPSADGLFPVGYRIPAVLRRDRE